MNAAVAFNRKVRSARQFLRGLTHTAHPLLVQIIPIRRCNIDCGYCNEYDKVSDPVPGGHPEATHRQARRTGHVGRRVQRRRADAASGSRRPDSPHPRARHDGRPDHQRLLSGAETDRGAQRRGPRFPADQHRQRRARRSVEEEPARARQEAAAPAGPRHLRRQHQLGARRRHQEPGRRADDQRARAGARLLHLDRHHPRRIRTAEAARPGRAQGVRRGLGRDQRPWQVFKNLYSGITTFQDNLADGRAKRVALPRGRALPLCLRGRPGALLLAAARLPAVPLESYSTDDIRREFATPKSCAPYCTVGCVHRVSTMDFWRSPQSAVASRRSAVASHK